MFQAREADYVHTVCVLDTCAGATEPVPSLYPLENCMSDKGTNGNDDLQNLDSCSSLQQHSFI